MAVENVGLATLPRIHDRQQPSAAEEALEAASEEGRWTSRLATLRVRHCHRLRSLGASLLQQQHLLKSLDLESLSITNCDSVVCDIPDGFKGLTGLRDVSLYDCPEMVVGKFHTSVRTVQVSECFVAHADEDPFLFSVWNLKITGCSHVSSSDQASKVERLDWLSSLLNVYNLHLENTVLLRLHMFDQLPSLEILEIDGCDAFFADLSGLAWPEKLQVLSIRNCREMSGLPENLCALPALEELCVQNCPAIEALPENGLPASRKRLSIFHCGPRLTERCLDDELDRPKIALVAAVYIDGKCIQLK